MYIKVLLCMIQTGILCIPAMDDETIQTISAYLRNTIPELLFVIEQGADSQRHWIERCLTQWCDEEELDLVITVGGTMPAPGPSSLEIVPDATIAICERLLPGLSAEMRFHAATQTSLALLDRSVVGIRGRTLIINLPEGTPSALLFLEAIGSLIEPTIGHLKQEPDRVYLSDVLAPVGDDMGDADEVDPIDRLRHGISVDVAEIQDDKKQFGLDANEFAAFLGNLPAR